MAQGEGKLTRRAILAAPMVIGQTATAGPVIPAQAGTAIAAPSGMPAAPAGFVWICVREIAWAQLKAAQAVLAALDRALP